MIHGSFKAWVVAEVLPLHQEHPEWVRLDGQASGGNRSVAGQFRHLDRDWVVHADTHFEPVLRAYRAITAQGVDDPFAVDRARVGDCLELRPELGGASWPKYFYVYGR